MRKDLCATICARIPIETPSDLKELMPPTWSAWVVNLFAYCGVRPHTLTRVARIRNKNEADDSLLVGWGPQVRARDLTRILREGNRKLLRGQRPLRQRAYRASTVVTIPARMGTQDG